MRVRNASERALIVMHAAGDLPLSPGEEGDVPEGTHLPPEIVPAADSPPEKPKGTKARTVTPDGDGQGPTY